MDLWKLLVFFLTLRWLFGSSAASSPTAFGGEPVCDDRNHNGICDDEEKNLLTSGRSDDEGITAPATVLPAYDPLSSLPHPHQADPLAQEQPEIAIPFSPSFPANADIDDESAAEALLQEYLYGDDDFEEAESLEKYENCYNEEEYEEAEEDDDNEETEEDDTLDSFGFIVSDEDDTSWTDSLDDEDS